MLEVGKTYNTQNGIAVNITKAGSRGGQGQVYFAKKSDGTECVVKYIFNPNETIKKNIEEHYAKRETLPQDFVWPEGLIDCNTNGIAYVMEKVSPEYKQLVEFIWPDRLTGKLATFDSIEIQIKTCINIISGFRNLNLKGYYYQDMSDNNFFINPHTGDIKIIDTDNVCNGTEKPTVLGTFGFMAPEIIRGDSIPSQYTDLFSLAAILFCIFCRGNPLMGALYRGYRMPSDKEKKLVFGEKPVFVLDKDDKTNRPVQSLDDGVINFWGVCPPELQVAFRKAFSKEALLDPSKRLNYKEWLKIFLDLRAKLVICSACGVQYSGSLSHCPYCKTQKTNFKFLKFIGKKEDDIPIYPGKKIYGYDIDKDVNSISIIGEVIRSKKNPKIWGIVNRSDNHWTYLETENNRTYNLEKGEVLQFPSCKLELSFTNNVKAIIDMKGDN